jgi:hypothetical protein
MACYDSSECFEECVDGYVKVESGLFCWDRCCPLAPPPLPVGGAPSAPGPACYEDHGCFTDCAPGFVTIASSACWEFCCVERSQPHVAIPHNRDVVGVMVPLVALVSLAAVVCAFVAGRCQERKHAIQMLAELIELPNRGGTPRYSTNYDAPAAAPPGAEATWGLLPPALLPSDHCSHGSAPTASMTSSSYMVVPRQTEMARARRTEQGGAHEPPPPPSPPKLLTLPPARHGGALRAEAVAPPPPPPPPVSARPSRGEVVRISL